MAVAPTVSPSTSTRDPVEAILWKMRQTKGARFEAHRRLISKNNLSLFAQSLLAIYVIIASLTPLLYPGFIPLQLMSVVTVATSIFLLVLNNLEAAQAYPLQAERMLRCAEMITEVYNRLELDYNAKTASFDHCKEALRLYHEILANYSENHEHIDLKSFRANDRKRFGVSWLEARWIRIKWFCDIWSFYLLIMAIPPGIVVAEYFVHWI